jgi:hypothetical protein
MAVITKTTSNSVYIRARLLNVFSHVVSLDLLPSLGLNDVESYTDCDEILV